jgi:hypothetical protein
MFIEIGSGAKPIDWPTGVKLFFLNEFNSKYLIPAKPTTATISIIRSDTPTGRL